MKKNGYTIIEIISVIIILSIVSLLAVNTLSKSLNYSRAIDMENIEMNITSATEIYINENSVLKDNLYKNKELVIYLSDLQESGLIENNLRNYVTGQRVKSDTKISIMLKSDDIIYNIDYKMED